MHKIVECVFSILTFFKSFYPLLFFRVVVSSVENSSLLGFKENIKSHRYSLKIPSIIFRKFLRIVVSLCYFLKSFP